MNRLFRNGGLGIAAAALAAGSGIAGAGAAGAATSAPQSAGPVIYTPGWAGYQDGNYQAGGRRYRFVCTTVTVPARKVPDPHHDDSGAATILLWGPTVEYAELSIEPGGGAGTIGWTASNSGTGPSFRVSPKVGDSVTLSIYSDRQGHTSFTAADTTQGTTQTVRVKVHNSPYTTAGFFVNVDPSVTPPATDTLLWQFTGSRVTTNAGIRGTITGPWTRKVIETSTGTSTGAVVLSPGPLRHRGQNFGVWLRRR